MCEHGEFFASCAACVVRRESELETLSAEDAMAAARARDVTAGRDPKSHRSEVALVWQKHCNRMDRNEGRRVPRRIDYGGWDR